jgi:CRP-like cAMP-binding protein
MVDTGNSVLDSLSPSLRDAILRESRACLLPLQIVLLHPGKIPNHLVFLTSGMASLVTSMQNGGASEVGMLGSEGVSGVSSMLGSDPSQTECIVQIAGEGLQVPREHLMHLFKSSPELREHILQLAQTQMNVSAQLAGCNLQHQAEHRFARWLLTASDRIGSDNLPMTQEFIAGMISTRRTTVSLIVGRLQKQGYIQQRRGTIAIIDRLGLANIACECYELCRQWTYRAASVPTLLSA